MITLNLVGLWPLIAFLVLGLLFLAAIEIMYGPMGDHSMVPGCLVTAILFVLALAVIIAFYKSWTG